MLNMAMLLRVVNEGEHVVVNQVVEEVNPSVEVGPNTCETSQEPDFSVNEGKPRMHTTLPYILQIDFAFASFYCIKWLEVKWKPNWYIINLVIPYLPYCQF